MWVLFTINSMLFKNHAHVCTTLTKYYAQSTCLLDTVVFVKHPQSCQQECCLRPETAKFV